MTSITIEVPSDIKKEAEKLFNDLGLDMNTAINMFLKKAIMVQGIPFDFEDLLKEND